MKIFGKYFGYISKKAILRTVIFLVLGFAFVWMSAMSGVDESNIWHDKQFNKTYDNRYTNIGEISTILGFLCTLVPILELSAFKNRRNLDTLYFFPIKRWKMALAHYLSGFLQIATVHTVCFFGSFGFYLLYTDCFDLQFMIPYYFASLGLGIILYSIFMFINSQANTVVDGVLFSIFWISVAYVAAGIIGVIATGYLEAKIVNAAMRPLYDWTFIYSPLNNVTMIFQKMIHVNDTSPIKIDYYISELYAVAVWGILGIGSIAGYFLTFIKKGAQKAGEASTSFLGYRMLIPLYSLLLLVLGGSWLFIVMGISLMIIGYVIFRRGFKFKLPDILSMVGTVIVAVIINAL